VNVDDAVLRRAVDRVALADLTDTYADVVNRRAFDELEGLFLPDCEVVIDARRGEPIVTVGGEALGAFVDASIERFDFFEFVILSRRVWVDGTDDARGRLYMCELRRDRASGQPSQAFGVYHDRFRRVDERWWFAARRYHSLARTAANDQRGLDVFEFPHAEEGFGQRDRPPKV
jgi:SnoaL-like domain